MFVSAWKRRVLVGDLQYRLVGGNLFYLCFVVFAFAAVLFGPLVMLLGDRSATVAQREVAARQMLALHERVWFAIPMIIALCLLHSVVVSHRIAGPLLRFRRIFQGLARGDLSQNVAVRRHDYLHAEAAAIADMMGSMAAKMRAIESGHAAASAMLSDLRQDLERTSQRATAAKGEMLAAQMEILGQRISQFRTPAIDAEQPQEKSQPLPELVGSM